MPLKPWANGVLGRVTVQTSSLGLQHNVMWMLVDGKRRRGRLDPMSPRSISLTSLQVIHLGKIRSRIPASKLNRKLLGL